MYVYIYIYIYIYVCVCVCVYPDRGFVGQLDLEDL